MNATKVTSSALRYSNLNHRIIRFSDLEELLPFCPLQYGTILKDRQFRSLFCQTKQCVLVRVSVSSVKAPYAKARRRGNDLIAEGNEERNSKGAGT